jgi:hypothetical protein
MNNFQIEALRNDVELTNSWLISAMDEEEFNNFVSLHPDERSIRVNDKICADEIIYSNDHPYGVWCDPLRNHFYEVKPII